MPATTGLLSTGLLEDSQDQDLLGSCRLYSSLLAVAGHYMH